MQTDTRIFDNLMKCDKKSFQLSFFLQTVDCKYKQTIELLNAVNFKVCSRQKKYLRRSAPTAKKYFWQSVVTMKCSKFKCPCDNHSAHKIQHISQ